MNINEMQTRLLSRLREKVRNGYVTERGFARTVGISQPHVHKVLKGTRTLSLDGLDTVMRSLNYSILDLCTETELNEHLSKVRSHGTVFTNMRFQDGLVGPEQGGVGPMGQEMHAVPCRAFEQHREAMLVRLGPDPEMAYSAEAWDIAVLVNEHNRPLCAEAVYAVDRGPDVVLRRIRRGAAIIYLASDAVLYQPDRWEGHPWRAGSPAPTVCGRLVWLGRECEGYGLGEWFPPQAPNTTRS